MCGVLAAINRHAIHEGRESIIIRSSQDSERVDMKVASCELEISGKEAASFKVDDVFKAIETLAGQLARDQAKGFFETLNEVTDRTGNVVDGRGKPLTHETFFEMLEKMEHNFPNGPKSTDLVAVVPPSMIERLQRLDAEFQNSPELKK